MNAEPERDRNGSEPEVLLGWGLEAVEKLGPLTDVLVVVDVLSFSTCVEVALSRGATVFPYRSRDDAARSFAGRHDAYLAGRRGDAAYSLSPVSLRTLPAGARLVLPSPNGATLSLAAREHGIVLAGCLRNARAIAEACRDVGGMIGLVPAGERTPADRWRPALEDQLGAGAIASRLRGGRCSPEVRSAIAAFDGARERLLDAIRASTSGRELLELDHAEDIEVAAALDVSNTVARLDGEAFRSLDRPSTRERQ
jgi:2-phosphosulfolactate phosphatase